MRHGDDFLQCRRSRAVGIVDVGDDGNPEDLHPRMDGGDHFLNGGKADGFGADGFKEPGFGRGLEARALESDIDPLADRDAGPGGGLLGAGDQVAVVGPGSCPETAPPSRLRWGRPGGLRRSG